MEVVGGGTEAVVREVPQAQDAELEHETLPSAVLEIMVTNIFQRNSHFPFSMLIPTPTLFPLKVSPFSKNWESTPGMTFRRWTLGTCVWRQHFVLCSALSGVGRSVRTLCRAPAEGWRWRVDFAQSASGL